MSRPLRLHAPGILHHVFTRGNDKACIFEDDIDHRAFLDLLARTLARFGVECVAFCLLWNHYHLAVVPHEQPLWRLMQQLNSTYCQHFNRRHGRIGHVLQGRYGCRIVEDGAYARTVLRYLALNPVQAGRVVSASDWQWGSYRAALGLDTVPDFLALDYVWSAFGTLDPMVGRTRLIEFVGADLEDSFHDTLLFGSDRLASYAASRLEPHQSNIDFSYAHRYAARPSLAAILDGCVDRASAQDAAFAAFRRHGYTLADVGRALGRDPSTICRWIQRAAARRAADDPGRCPGQVAALGASSNPGPSVSPG
jgi:putative transposase